MDMQGLKLSKKRKHSESKKMGGDGEFLTFIRWLSLENYEAGNGLWRCQLSFSKDTNRETYDGCSFSWLVHGRAGGQPAHADSAVAVVPDIQSLKWDWFLFAMTHHELLAAGEDWLGNVVGLRSTLVDDDGDSRRVIDEILGQCCQGLLDGIALDQALEGRGNTDCLLPVHACPLRLRQRRAHAPRTFDVFSAWNRLLGLSGGCGECRASEGRGGEDGESAHVDCCEME